MYVRCQQAVAAVLVLVSLQVFVDLIDQQGHCFEGSPAKVHYRSCVRQTAERGSISQRLLRMLVHFDPKHSLTYLIKKSSTLFWFLGINVP